MVACNDDLRIFWTEQTAHRNEYETTGRLMLVMNPVESKASTRVDYLATLNVNSFELSQNIKGTLGMSAEMMKPNKCD